jgi:hypothetical protein
MKVLELTSENPDPNEVRSGALALCKAPPPCCDSEPWALSHILARLNPTWALRHVLARKVSLVWARKVAPRLGSVLRLSSGACPCPLATWRPVWASSPV